jgi:hypothetical protein
MADSSALVVGHFGLIKRTALTVCHMYFILSIVSFWLKKKYFGSWLYFRRQVQNMNTKPTLLGPLGCADLCPKRWANRE